MFNLNAEDEERRLTSLIELGLLDTPLDNRFERVTRLVQAFFKVPIASFNLIDRERQWTKSIQGLSVVELARQQSFCAHAIQGDDALIVPDARKDERFAQNSLVTGKPNIVFYAGYPVRAPDGEKIGALCAIDRAPRQLTARESQTLRDLAGVLESEIRLDQLSRQMAGLSERLEASERIALVDPLTRLWNRAGTVKIFQQAWNDSVRRGEPLAVLVCDIDAFRGYNDTRGRERGDELLRDMAKMFLSSLRQQDSLGRLEDDRFLAVLPGCGGDCLPDLAERLRQSAELSEEPDGPAATVSLGGACVRPSAALDIEDILRRADDALVLAKKAGGNRSIIQSA